MLNPFDPMSKVASGTKQSKKQNKRQESSPNKNGKCPTNQATNKQTNIQIYAHPSKPTIRPVELSAHSHVAHPPNVVNPQNQSVNQQFLAERHKCHTHKDQSTTTQYILLPILLLKVRNTFVDANPRTRLNTTKWKLVLLQDWFQRKNFNCCKMLPGPLLGVA